MTVVAFWQSMTSDILMIPSARKHQPSPTQIVTSLVSLTVVSTQTPFVHGHRATKVLSISDTFTIYGSLVQFWTIFYSQIFFRPLFPTQKAGEC